MSTPCAQSPLPVIISDSTLLNFVAGSGFDAAVSAQFREHDADEDGCLSRAELCNALHDLRLFDDYLGYEERHGRWPCGPSADGMSDALFEQFDVDGDGVVTAADFASQVREIMLGIAHGLRGCPLHVLLYSGSILSHAVQYEQNKTVS